MATSAPDTTHYTIDGNEIWYHRELWIEFENYVPAFDHYNYNDYSDIGLGNIFGDLNNVKLVNYVWYEINLRGSFFLDNIISEKSKFIHLEIFPSVATDQITLYLPEVLTVFPSTIQIIEHCLFITDILYLYI